MSFAKLLLLFLCLLLFAANAVIAQTDTPTPISTWTPEVYQYWTMEPAINAEGTQEADGVAVAFGLEANAGDVAIAVLLAVLIFALWAMFVIWLLTNRKDANAGGDRSSPTGAGDRRDAVDSRRHVRGVRPHR